MKKSTVIILVLGLFCSCSYKTSNDCLDALKTKLVNNLKDKEELNFKEELDCFEWDSMMLVDRHFNAEDVKKRTGVDLSGYKLMGIEYAIKSDYRTYIAFLKNKEIVGVIDTSKGVFIDDFITELNNNDVVIISKDDANFIIYSIKNNKFIDGRNMYSLTFKDKNNIGKYSNLPN